MTVDALGKEDDNNEMNHSSQSVILLFIWMFKVRIIICDWSSSVDHGGSRQGKRLNPRNHRESECFELFESATVRFICRRSQLRIIKIFDEPSVVTRLVEDNCPGSGRD